ncbi:hypothetical protein [Actinomadura sp. KC345]|uniref:hypothetical protein n=1 Tax=Actinomadura sp. KC345 TaxID=2530371 RepID=UPI001A9FF6ED|nr:hypothetical protein [Actinomadura sp. KC345]
MTETSTTCTAETTGRQDASPAEPATGSAGGSAAETRADRFVRQIAEMRIPDPAAGRALMWLRVGMGLMVAGLVAGVAAYFLSRGTTDSLAQRDAQAVGIAGVCACIVGSALYLRYTLANVLRFWFARLTLTVEAGAEKVERTQEND